MKSVKDVFGMKQKPDTVFINPAKQNPQEVEDYAVKKSISTQELNSTTEKLTYISGSGVTDILTCQHGTTKDIVLYFDDGDKSGEIQIYYFGSKRMVFNGLDGIGFSTTGTYASASSAILNLISTTKGALLPRMTTSQKNAISSPAEGLQVYDTTLHKMCVYTGSTWETITSA